MPADCCVPLCTQRGCRDNAGNKVSFHSFPRDPVLRKKWLVAIKRDEEPSFTITKSKKVCSKHFEACDFIPHVVSGWHILRDTAVPSVFPFSFSKNRKPPKKREPLPKRVKRSPVQPHSTQEREAEVSNGEGEDTAHSRDVVSTEEDCETHADRETTKALAEASEISTLKQQCNRLREELAKERAKLTKVIKEKAFIGRLLEEEIRKNVPFSLSRFRESSEDFMFYTGLPDYSHFVALFEYACPNGHTDMTLSASYGRERKLSAENQLFLVLVRLRLGLFERDLAHRFNISQATVSSICSSWINRLYCKLVKLPLWAPRHRIDETMPATFLGEHSATRVILEAIEVRCAVPSSLALQSSTYSAHKPIDTFKGLVGTMPNGSVSYVSELLAGSMSDRECVIRSGFLNLEFDEGDVVMADERFRINDLLEEKGVGLILPPFLHEGKLSVGEVDEAWEMDLLRIHIERRINRIKSFHIFDRPIPLTLAPLINQIWTVAVILTNFQAELVAGLEPSSPEVS
uniref:Putative tick transposon n=1 Tax=Rhipicephalus pulchellus TaxID=72859 RepID=L7M2E7_RHIPC